MKEDKLSDNWVLLENWLLDRLCKTNTCWNWISSIHRDGYGKCCKNGFWQAHRLSYYVFNRGIDKTLLVLHKCHNRKCVNPEHLYQGTHSDNNKDTIIAGRGKNQFETKDKHWNFKYSDEQVKMIKENTLSSYKLSELINIPASTIRSIRNGSSRKEVV